jgi:hypothetical protein
MEVYLITLYHRDTYEYAVFRDPYYAHSRAMEWLDEYRAKMSERLHYNFELERVEYPQNSIETFYYSLEEMIHHLTQSANHMVRIWEIDDDAMSYREIWCSITRSILH